MLLSGFWKRTSINIKIEYDLEKRTAQRINFILNFVYYDACGSWCKDQAAIITVIWDFVDYVAGTNQVIDLGYSSGLV